MASQISKKISQQELRRYFRLRSVLSLAFCALMLPLATVRAEDRIPSDHHPRPCVGYSSATKRWGWKWMSELWMEATCDPSFAVYELDNPSFIRPNWFNCCPLPANDILVDEHVYVEDSCPENFVVTGQGRAHPPYYLRPLRCTKINTKRYELLPPESGLKWGYGTSKILVPEGEKLRKTEIPDAIASSYGRKSLGIWDQNGCTPKVFGSLLTGVLSDTCDSTRFRTLVFKGVDSDPPRGYPVTMFPSCRRIADIFDPQTACIQNGLTPDHLKNSQTDYGEAEKNPHR